LRLGETRAYPVLPLRDIVVFPHVIAPLFVGRKKSILALEEVMRSVEPSTCAGAAINCHPQRSWRLN
jgi:ATP-dependent Lon protease